MKRWIWRITASLAILLILVAGAGILVLRSQWFLDYLRTQIVEQAQRATGATVEIGALRLDWTTLRVSVDRFVLHGKEAPGEPPFVSLNSATLGLRIVSILRREADLRSLEIDAPQVRIVVYPDGSTNIPGPQASSETLWTEPLLNLKIGEYRIENGVIEYDDRSVPLNLRGQNLQARMDYLPATPAYHGTLSSDAIHVTPSGYAPFDAGIDTEFTLEANRVQFARLHLTAPGTSVDLSGTLDDLRNPRGTLSLNATTSLNEVIREFRLGIDASGTATFNGNLALSFENEFTYQVTGNLSARGLRYVQDSIRIDNAVLTANTEISQAGATLRAVTLRALGATVTGEARISEWKTADIKGTLSGLNLRRAAGLATPREVPWDGTVSGPFTATLTFGKPDLIAKTTLSIEPAPEREPIRGHIEVAYDQARGTVALGTSSIETSATRLEVEGTLGQTLRVRGRTSRLEDLTPVIAFAQGSEVTELPLKLNNGSISIDGTVTGALEDPQFRGQVSVANGQVQEYTFDQFSAELDLNERQVVARNISLARNGATLTGTGALTARGGDGGDFANSEVVAQLNLRNLDLAEAARLAGVTEPLSGTASANARISGTLQQPEATVALDILNPAAGGERSDRLRADIRYLPTSIEISNGILNDGGSEVRFSGAYNHPLNNLRAGDVSFSASTAGLPAVRIENIAKLEPKVDGIFAGRVEAAGTFDANGFALKSANADIAAREIVVDGEPVGNATLQAQTSGNDLALMGGLNIRESRVDLSGSWKLEGDSPGMANVRFSRIGIESLRDLATREAVGAPLTLEGFIEGEASVNVSLRKPEDFQAQIRLSTIQVNPRDTSSLRGVTPEDTILRNSEPVVIDVSAKEAAIRSARFTGRNTEIEVAGRVPFEGETGADLSARGTVDLSVLQLLEPELDASGIASINATIRGSLSDPNVNGQLSLQNAQAHFGDLPNGIDNATGTILFDRRRATVQQLTAETGGGQVEFSGFVDFGQTLVYRLQAQARNVRVRYPQDVSTTFDADLSLNGTTADSVLAGNVALTRSAFTVSTDLGDILARSGSQPVATPDSDEDFLSGVQMRIRIQNSPNFQVETSLATNVDADVDLTLRGTPSRPVLQGLISVNRGEAEVFGNKYIVDRADIRFTNPVRIEPNFDVDLTTRVRGINVTLSISGTPSRINFNSSSDPPLQSSEIIALLAMGRDPSTTASRLAPGVNTNASNNFLQAGGSLVSQAVMAPATNQLQRFFGATRVQIDPTLTGVDNLPQARLTFNQQVSKDITLTYITNLNRTQDQIVRFQWDFSREWSMVAVRDPNGVVSLDFQFRRRFK